MTITLSTGIFSEFRRRCKRCSALGQLKTRPDRRAEADRRLLPMAFGPTNSSKAVPFPAISRLAPLLPRSVLGRVAPEAAIGSSGALVPDAAERFLEQASDAARPTFAYLPWIKLHGDALIQQLPRSERFSIVPLQLFEGTSDGRTRRLVARLAKQRPAEYRQLLLEQVARLAGRVAGFLFTFDWHPVMRGLADVCRELGIARLLIPHESVFADRQRYYRYAPGNIGRPSCDRVLCWGALQRDVFTERGYPIERTVIVGSPKLDRYHDYRPSLTREVFFERLGLDPARKTLLFVGQALDMAGGRRQSRDAQQRAIADTLAFARAQGHNFLLRAPPSADRLVSAWSGRLEGRNVAHDAGPTYVACPEDALFHCDLVVSLNSTMLFEAALLGVPSIAATYFDFECLWTKADIPRANGRQELFSLAQSLLARRTPSVSDAGWRWAKQQFSAGAFDGGAGQRIVAELEASAASPASVYDPVRELLRGAPLENVAIAHPDQLDRSQRYLRELLGARALVPVSGARSMLGGLKRLLDPSLRGEMSVALFGDGPTRRAFHSDLCLQWGIAETPRKRRLREAAARAGKSVVYAEDGFLRSVGLGQSGEPGLSLLLDPEGFYYDARRPSALERALASERELTPAQRERASAAMRHVVSLRVSKYNHAPQRSLPTNPRYARRVLVVDQRRNDASIEYGLANAQSFLRMLEHAIADNPDAEILVKRHPDAIAGGHASSFPDLRLGFPPNVTAYDRDINPYSLFEAVDTVYVVTSGMGFEALMAGKQVHCFGMPFYAGWGCTHDALRCDRRTRSRSVEELFHFAYVEFTRYFDPESGSRCSVERLADYLAGARAASAKDGGSPAGPAALATPDATIEK